MHPLRRFRLWIFLKDIRREHKALVRAFEKDPRAAATIAVCTCMPGAIKEWPKTEHGPGCRTWLT